MDSCLLFSSLYTTNVTATSRVAGVDSSSRLSVAQQLISDWAVRVTGVHAEAKNQWRLANSLGP
jgi:hypothetical protein